MIEVQIHDVGFGGKGVARHEGKVIFVPFVIPGERVAVEITRDRKKFAEADLVRVLEPSPNRTEPKCPYFGVCGGCAYQHIEYGTQLQLKADQVAQVIKRIGKVDPVPMQPAIGAPHWYGYRNRIRVHSAEGVVGFYARNRASLIDIEVCPIASDEVNSKLARFRRSRPAEDGDCLIGDRQFQHFEQTNDEMAALMLAHVRSLVPASGGVLVDAYCGAGFFAYGMRDLFQTVIGIEENSHAISKARAKAGPGMVFIEGDVAVHLPAVLNRHPAAETVLLLDPPAAGLSPRVVDQIVSSRPESIIYVSCDPSTLARDLAALAQTFRVRSVTPLDMFPQTAEIETIVSLTR